MLDVRNCRRCGKLFNLAGGVPLCHACRQLEEEDFKRVKEYLYQNPGSSLSQVSLELDIGVERIKRFLREGRLEIVGSDGNVFLECESCGVPINSGRFCSSCTSSLSGELKKAAGKMSSSLSDRTDLKGTSSIKYLYKDERNK